MPRFRVFRRDFWIADPATAASLARMDQAGPIGVTDLCVTDVGRAPYPPVRVANLPMVAWPAAYPEWDDLTAEEKAQHRDVCAEGCGLCEGFRAWGLCPQCGHGNAEANSAGDSLCCRVRLLIGAEAERAWV